MKVFFIKTERCIINVMRVSKDKKLAIIGCVVSLSYPNVKLSCELTVMDFKLKRYGKE